MGWKYLLRLLWYIKNIEIARYLKDRRHPSCFDYLWYNETRFDLDLSLTGIFFRGFLTLEKFDLEKLDLEKFELEFFHLGFFELDLGNLNM